VVLSNDDFSDNSFLFGFLFFFFLLYLAIITQTGALPFVIAPLTELGLIMEKKKKKKKKKNDDDTMMKV